MNKSITVPLLRLQNKKVNIFDRDLKYDRIDICAQTFVTQSDRQKIYIYSSLTRSDRNDISDIRYPDIRYQISVWYL